MADNWRKIQSVVNIETAPLKQAIEWYQGESIQLEIKVGNGVDLLQLETGGKILFQAWSGTDTTVLYVNDTGSIITPTSGLVRSELDPTETSMDAGDYNYIVRLMDADDSQIGTLLEGVLTVNASPSLAGVGYIGTTAPLSLTDLDDVVDTPATQGDVLTRQADGTYDFETPGTGSGTGDFLADGSIPMTGTFDGGGNLIDDVSGVQLNTTTPSAVGTVGEIRWNDTDKCAEIVTENGTVLQVGQEENVYARNTTGSLIPNGSPVYVSGATGNRPTIALADSGAEATADTVIGLVTGSAGIADNADGFVTTFGLVRGLDTSSATEGDTIYLSNTAGEWTLTHPTTASEYVVHLGVVTRSSPTVGEILVNVDSHGTVIADNLRHASSALAARAAIWAGDFSSSGTVAMTGNLDLGSNNIVSVGTVDGRDVSADGTKLDGIESAATTDQSDAEIEAAYNNQVTTVSQAEAEAGTATTIRTWTAERVKQAIAALGGGGGGSSDWSVPFTAQNFSWDTDNASGAIGWEVAQLDTASFKATGEGLQNSTATQQSGTIQATFATPPNATSLDATNAFKFVLFGDSSTSTQCKYDLTLYGYNSTFGGITTVDTLTGQTITTADTPEVLTLATADLTSSTLFDYYTVSIRMHSKDNDAIYLIGGSINGA